MDLRLSRLQLNELELLAAGAYGEPPTYALPGTGDHIATLRIPRDVPPDELILLDTEATPIARVEITETVAAGRGLWVSGVVHPLREPTPPPFPELRPAANLKDPLDSALLVIGNSGTPNRGAGAVVLVDDGDAEALSRAVERAQRGGHEVRILPRPAAHHLDAEATTALLVHLAGVLFASSVHLSHAPRSVAGEGVVVLFTGLSGSGKSTIARALTRRLRAEGSQRVTLLDGDEVRAMLSSGLGYSREDRELNVRRIGWVASLVSAHGGVAICAPIAPYESMREEMREMAESVGRFVLVHVATPLEVCEARDRKGLYAKARAGEIKEFTGISDTYEAPTQADLVIDTSREPVEGSVQRVFDTIRRATDDDHAAAESH